MKTKKLWSIMMMLVLVLTTAFSLSSCNKDDDDLEPSSIADYYVEFSVYDRGTLSASTASQFAAELNTLGIEMNGYTLEQAKYLFNSLLNSLVDNDRYSFNATFLASLKTEGRTVYKKKIYYSQNGCRVE